MTEVLCDNSKFYSFNKICFAFPVPTVALLNVALAFVVTSVAVSPLTTPLIAPWLLIVPVVVPSYVLLLTVGFVPHVNAFAVIFAVPVPLVANV